MRRPAEAAGPMMKQRLIHTVECRKSLGFPSLRLIECHNPGRKDHPAHRFGLLRKSEAYKKAHVSNATYIDTILKPLL